MRKCKATGKTVYESHKKADSGKLWIYSHDPSTKIGDLETYDCPFCKGIHIRHKPRRG